MGTEDKVEVGVQYISTRRDLPVFRGENGERVEEWIERIESHLDATHYPQAERLAFLMEYIDGVARREVKAEGCGEVGLGQNSSFTTGLLQPTINDVGCFLCDKAGATTELD